jgi:hypothetical protein
MAKDNLKGKSIISSTSVDFMQVLDLVDTVKVLPATAARAVVHVGHGKLALASRSGRGERQHRQWLASSVAEYLDKIEVIASGVWGSESDLHPFAKAAIRTGSVKHVVTPMAMPLYTIHTSTPWTPVNNKGPRFVNPKAPHPDECDGEVRQ